MAHQRIEAMVVGVDGSDASRGAFDWAAQVAARLGAGVVLVHAVGLLEHRDDPDHQAVHGWLDQLSDPDVWIERVVREGDPLIVLQAVVAERQAQLVVVGTRGVGEATTMLGSTSTQVLHRSSVPVTVVPSA